MRDISFEEVRLEDVNLRRSDGERVVFEGVNLQRGDLYAAQLSSARFFDCNLRGVDVCEPIYEGRAFMGPISPSSRAGNTSETS
jgi:uncharacterized protein YjbI with pentapeptide repeats